MKIEIEDTFIDLVTICLIGAVMLTPVIGLCIALNG
jgi:hypothetical protein